MLNALAATLLAMIQQGFTSPPGGDTLGYWQQRVTYTMTATLDERAARVRARGTMRYVNNSPDTLREMFVHQYLNAFRPGSKWSAADEREGRVRFQHLREPDFGFERFTAPVRVNGREVAVQYPGAPDSTVARFTLPAPLAPGDSATVSFEWEARPSTIPRRQGRRGRSWDLAQWYPKVAVYDRGGWQPNALQPAGEFYGEFGTYDVTIVIPIDQVIGATGVPVSGDPGWSRALRAGAVTAMSHAYSGLPEPPDPDVPPGHRAVRFHARDVHHFAWSVSPQYRYEGGAYVRSPPPSTRGPSADSRALPDLWDTVAVHALYRPGDDSTWGGLRVVRRTINAIRWLESIYGPYAYPQMTVLHRLDGGGTEFPMMQMNGSPSQGLILHEGGHVWTYGILANNEWRSGWMDEGLTSYQTEWAQGLTPQERLRAGITDQFTRPAGYRRRAISLAVSRFDWFGLQRTLGDLHGNAEPIGTIAHEFRDFGTYNDMIYNRAQVMYGQLRDVLGDSAWVAFLHDYYARWALKHVDEQAMRASAERVSGRDLRWFFDQWVRRSGVMDYALDGVRRSRGAGGAFVTEATVRRRGEYRHAISVGVRTKTGWTTVRLPDPSARRQTVRITTPDEPLEVRLDPFHFSWDWDRRNDVERASTSMNFDWPLLRQADRERSLVLFRPMAWYSAPGGANLGLRARSSYLGTLDRWEGGVVHAARAEIGTSSALQYWTRMEDPYLPFLSRPAMGWSAGAARLDDILKMDIGYRAERSAGQHTVTSSYALNYTKGLDTQLLPAQWTRRAIVDVAALSRVRRDRGEGGYWFLDLAGAAGAGESITYAKAELATGGVYSSSDAVNTASFRLYGGSYFGDPVGQRALYLSARDPLSSFSNHWWRPDGAILKRPGINALPLGGAGLRGVHWSESSDDVVALNVDVSRRIAQVQRASATIAFRLHLFGDGAGTGDMATPPRYLGDAGAGVSARGRIYDRDISIRLDAPFLMSEPALAIDRDRAGSKAAQRWVLTFGDIW